MAGPTHTRKDADMPLSRRVALFNRAVTNRTIGRIAPWAPGFGVVRVAGRRSGRVRATPVNVFRRGEGYVIALTYGAGADWVRNVVAAGGCDLQTRGRHIALTRPRLSIDPSRAAMPGPIRAVLRLARVEEFLTLSAAGVDAPAD